MAQEDVLPAGQVVSLWRAASQRRNNLKRPIIWAAAVILPWAAIIGFARVVVTALN